MKEINTKPDVKETGNRPERTEWPRERFAPSSNSIIPATGGTWTGDRGNSEFKPDLETKPNRFNYEPPKTWKEIINGNKDFVNKDTVLPDEAKSRLNNVYNRIMKGDEGVSFVKGDVDFSRLSLVTVKIDNFSTERYGTTGNMELADKKAAEQLTMKTEKFYEWRNNNELMWHECKDRKTMILISHDIHDNIPHAGGISEQKRIEDSTGSS